MESKMILATILEIAIALLCLWIIVNCWTTHKPSYQRSPGNLGSLTPLVIQEPFKEIWKVNTILRQCERWVDTDEHEMASIYYEIIANECKKLSEEHKKSV